MAPNLALPTFTCLNLFTLEHLCPNPPLPTTAYLTPVTCNTLRNFDAIKALLPRPKAKNLVLETKQGKISPRNALSRCSTLPFSLSRRSLLCSCGRNCVRSSCCKPGKLRCLRLQLRRQLQLWSLQHQAWMLFRITMFGYLQRWWERQVVRWGLTSPFSSFSANSTFTVATLDYVLDHLWQPLASQRRPRRSAWLWNYMYGIPP